jgi:cytochrome c oxidase cbb3-type subunit I
MNVTSSTSQNAPVDSSPIRVGDIDASCRVPLFVLFVSSAVWLVVASVFGLIASIKFHSPDFLSQCAWLTYGRVLPVAKNALLYGFAMQAGLGVALWIIARLGQVKASQPWLIALGGKLWNLGTLIGMIAILAGSSTGFENFEMPRYAAVFLFLGYLLIGIWTALTLHNRYERPLAPSQWFLLTALFWFPWIYSTAHLLLTFSTVRGVTQAVIAWWFSNNLEFVWLSLIGLAVIFYFIPKFAGRALHSHYLALFAFWTLILFGSWCGIPSSAPTPAWMPVASGIAQVLSVMVLIAVGLNIYHTKAGAGSGEKSPAAPFFFVGLGLFQLAGVMRVAGGFQEISAVTQFTWFTAAQWQLGVYGFFAMTMFGAIYYIVPRVTGMEWPWAKFVRVHFWLAAVGIALFALPLVVGGVLQGIKLNHPSVPFLEIAKLTLHFLRLSTLGEMLLLFGHLLLLGNIAVLSVRYYRTHFVPAYTSATVELAEVKP